MARVDLARRAEIGRDRSARTRAELVAAARGLYAARPFDQVTVDDVVAAAGVAKGTFYVHFDSVTDLQSVVADDLAREFDEFLQPRRLATGRSDRAHRRRLRGVHYADAAGSSRGARWSHAAPPQCRTSPASRASVLRRTSTSPRATVTLAA